MDYGYVHDLIVYLETPLSKIVELQSNYRDPARRKEAHLDYYVHNNPLASWTEVAEVLCVLGLRHQADVVENTYVQGMHLQSSLSHDVH